MDNTLTHLADWVAPLLDTLSAAERRTLAVAVAKDLRTQNTRTMRAQTAPDGTPWVTRKTPIRVRAKAQEKSGSVRRRTEAAQAMFVRLRTAKFLKAKGTPSEAVVTFVERAERIAAVHQFGLSDLVKPGGPTYNYPARPLLGITPESTARLGDLIISHLKGKAY